MTDMTTLDHRYTLLESIGSGGMGVVHKALDRLTGQVVALKQVASRRSTPFMEDDLTARLALAQEFRVLASLRHPNVITVLDYGFTAERQPYFTMRLLEAPRLISQFETAGSVEAQTRLLVQTLTALHYLHRRGVIHRDLKPTNILVEPNGVVQVVDFGLALSGAAEGSSGGTLAYMAPELLDNGKPSIAADLYAVGVIAYELYAGRHPFDASTLSRLLRQIALSTPDWEPLYPFDDLSGAYSPLRKVIARLMDKDPARRYQDAWETVEALCQAVGLSIPEEDSASRESFLQAASFIGRNAEIEALQGALKAVQESRQPQLWLVGGESGIGKSRLLDELRISALVGGWHVLRGQSRADLRLPYQLWRAPAQVLAISGVLDDLEAGILKALVPDIDALVGHPVAAAADLQGAAYAQRLALALVELLGSTGTPTLLILEDLQWAEDGLDLLKLVVTSLTDCPVLIVGSYRSDERPDLPQVFPTAQSMLLSRLDSQQIAALSASMLGESGEQPDVVNLLERETEGNIFFMVEVIRALAEEAGELRRIGDSPLPERVFAGGVQDVVRRRLRRLPEWALEFVRIAAVAGRELDLEVLRCLKPDSLDLEAWLTATANVAVLEIADQHWRFSHDKLRETLIADIPENVLRDLHCDIAGAIQITYPDNAQYAEALFEHLLAAGETARAMPYALTAARAALATSRYADVRRIVSAAHGAALGGAALGDAAPIQTSLDLLAAEAAYYLGDYAQVETLCNRILESVPEADSLTPGALLLLARVAVVRGSYPDGERLFNQARERSEQSGDRRGVADALFGLGQIAERQGDGDTARAHYEQALAIYRTLNLISGIADSLHGLGTVSYNAGDYEAAVGHFEDSLTMRRALGDRRAIASSLNNLGGTFVARRQMDRALEVFRESLTIRRAIGERRGVAMSLLNLGHIIEEQGDYEGAFEHFSESYDLFRALGVKQGIVISLLNLGSTWRLRGDARRARGLYDEALALTREMNDAVNLAHCLNGLAMTGILARDAEAALSASSEEITLRRDLGDTRFLALALWTCAEALRAANREASEVDAVLSEALELAREGDFVDVMLRVLKTQYERTGERPLLGVLRAERQRADVEIRRWISAQLTPTDSLNPPALSEVVTQMIATLKGEA